MGNPKGRPVKGEEAAESISVSLEPRHIRLFKLLGMDRLSWGIREALRYTATNSRTARERMGITRDEALKINRPKHPNESQEGKK